jgi:pyruvate oxidase
VIVVLSDRSLHLIRIHQERKGFPASGVDFEPIDFAGIAAGFGARGVRVATWGDFTDALTTAFHADRPTVVDVQIDPSDYSQML